MKLKILPNNSYRWKYGLLVWKSLITTFMRNHLWVQVRFNDALRSCIAFRTGSIQQSNKWKRLEKQEFFTVVGSKVASLWEPLLTSPLTKLDTTTSLVRHYATLALLSESKKPKEAKTQLRIVCKLTRVIHSTKARTHFSLEWEREWMCVLVSFQTLPNEYSNTTIKSYFIWFLSPPYITQTPSRSHRHRYIHTHLFKMGELFFRFIFFSSKQTRSVQSVTNRPVQNKLKIK